MIHADKSDDGNILARLIETLSNPQPLKRIVELGREACNSHTFTLVLANEEDTAPLVHSARKTLRTVACSSVHKELESLLEEKRFSLLPELASNRQMFWKYGLQMNGQGVANPTLAKKYGFDSLLSQPLISENGVFGYLNHFSTKRHFTSQEKSWLALFARQTVTLWTHLNTHQSAELLQELIEKLITLQPAKLLDFIAEKACALLSAHACVIWRKDEQTQRMKIVAASRQVDKGYRELKLKVDNYGVKKLFASSNTCFLYDISSPRNILEHKPEVLQRGWQSLLSAPLQVSEAAETQAPIGILDIFTRRKRRFNGWEKERFTFFARHAALAIQKNELIKQQADNRQASEKLRQLTKVLAQLAQARDEKALLELILDSSVQLTGAEHGAICQLNYTHGTLDIIAETGGLILGREALHFDKGLTGRALRKGNPVRVDDIGKERDFIECWEGTKSELAVPIILEEIQVREKDQVKLGTKPIGALNLESPRPAAFSQDDEDCLLSLAKHAAIAIERITHNAKLRTYREAERELKRARDYDETIGIVTRSIQDIIGFEYLNISLVNPSRQYISTKYIFGIPESEVAEFTKMALHPLDSKDIQADIVRTRRVEVPDVRDPRYDQAIFRRFGHDRLIRVFMPMIDPLSDRVIGTVDAGYLRAYRQSIYERDVQLLEGLVGYGVQAFERQDAGWLDKLMHEFKSPIVGIRSHASLLQRRYQQFGRELIEQKFDDILVDCDILLYQVKELAYIWGGAPPPTKLAPTYVYREIVIKTVKQLLPLVRELGASDSNVHYDAATNPRVFVHTDKAKLSAVMYNLLINAIKYAESDARDFQLRVEAEGRRGHFVIKVKDWGIGIKDAYKEMVFEEGFRSPEAIGKNVAGTGYGLTIAKQIMKQLGGDLLLVKNYKPTEFHVIIPKK